MCVECSDGNPGGDCRSRTSSRQQLTPKLQLRARFGAHIIDGLTPAAPPQRKPRHDDDRNSSDSDDLDDDHDSVDSDDLHDPDDLSDLEWMVDAD